jgi:hypothetical protein
MRAISELGPESVAKVVESLGSLEPRPIRPATLIDAGKHAVPDRDSAVEILLSSALFLRGLMRRSAHSAEEFVTAIDSAIGQSTQETKIDSSRPSSTATAFQRLLDSSAVALVAKAIDLTYDCANLYRQGRILTDVRPLFDDQADAVQAAVVSFTLRLAFDSADGDHEFSVAMDLNDVRRLESECRRSAKKAEVLQALISDRLDISSAISGEGADA